jgi:hypothetical protein
MARREWKWTLFQLDKLGKVKEILDELKNYTPLTLRQIYYQMVARGYIENTRSEYNMLSRLLERARVDKYIPWNVIEDRSRAFQDLRGWNDKDHFISQDFTGFLTGYRRDLLQSQDKYIELWIEKDALSRVFVEVAKSYSIGVMPCRGFISISVAHEVKERILYYKDRGRETVLLYFGDFDPSGNEISESIQYTLNFELGLEGLFELKRIALLKEDVFTYNLPHNPNALKKTDPRVRKHLEAYGELAVELDALRPDILEAKIKDAIEAELDIEAFNKEIDIYHAELNELSKIKQKIEGCLNR